MLHCRTREPNPWAGCRFEAEANEEPPRCAYCETCEVSAEGEFCSDQCMALALEDLRQDRATNEQRESEVSP